MIHIVITVEGGLVQDVSSDSEDVRVLIVDHDVTDRTVQAFRTDDISGGETNGSMYETIINPYKEFVDFMFKQLEDKHD